MKLFISYAMGARTAPTMTFNNCTIEVLKFPSSAEQIREVEEEIQEFLNKTDSIIKLDESLVVKVLNMQIIQEEKVKETTDYRQLFKKYLLHIGDWEGTNFTGYEGNFTKEEKEEIDRLTDEAEKERGR